jgi:hypothetical protein
MPLEREVRRRLLRVAGPAEVVGAAQASGEQSARESRREQVGFLMLEVHAPLTASDPSIGDGFERLVMREPETPIPPSCRLRRSSGRSSRSWRPRRSTSGASRRLPCARHLTESRRSGSRSARP